MVVINITEDENLAYDQGKKRTDSSIQKIFEGHELTKDKRIMPLCKMASTYGYIGASRQAIGLTNAQYYYKQNKNKIDGFLDYIDTIQADNMNILEKRAVLRALYLIMYNNLSIDGKEYIKNFITEDKPKSKITTLRESIIEGHIDSDIKIIDKSLLACYELAGLKAEGLKAKDICKMFTEKKPIEDQPSTDSSASSTITT